MKGKKRLMLLEFVTHERWVFNSRFFPFIKGGAEGLGYETLWLVFGSQFCFEKQGKTSLLQYMDLTDAELEFLSQHVREFQPSHVVISHTVSSQIQDCFLTGGVENKILFNFENPYAVLSLAADGSEESVFTDKENDNRQHRYQNEFGYGESNWFLNRTNWLLSWLGEREDTSGNFNKYIVGTLKPSYGVVTGNHSARSYKPHLIIMGGISCDYFSPVKSNAYYKDLDLSDYTQDFGCAYCTWYRGATSNMQEDPIKFVEEQLLQIIETAGEYGRSCGFFQLFDIRLFRQIDTLFDMILGLDLPPSTFCFEPRIDRFLEVEQKLEKVLQRLNEAGHKIYLFRMGAENLVTEENEIFNKGISLEQIDQATEHLARLKQRYSETFDYDSTYGYISCSPWTTLEMFEAGVTLAIERGFDPLGVWLYSPLLLFSNAPITKLAQQEGGIVVDAFEELALLYKAAVHQISFDTFVPWRFKDTRTATAFGLIVRYCAMALRHKYPDMIFHDDPLYYQLIKVAESSDVPFDQPDLFALATIACVKEYGSQYDKKRLLDLVVAEYIQVRQLFAAREKNEGAELFNDENELSAPEPVCTQRQQVVQQLVLSVVNRFSKNFYGMTVTAHHVSQESIALTVQIHDAIYEIVCRRYDSSGMCFFHSGYFNVIHRKETPVTSSQDQQKIKDFIRLFEKAAEKIVPELLPVKLSA